MSQDSTQEEQEQGDGKLASAEASGAVDHGSPPAEEPAGESDATESAQLTVETIDAKTLGELVKKAEERDLFLEELRRSRADFENYQKRMRRELSENERQAVRNFIAQLLPVQDNFERALAEGAGENVEAFREGVAMIQQMLATLLADHDTVAIEAQGQPFDPQLHEAVSQIEVDDPEEDGVVVSLIQKGYSQRNVVIRPARVVVGKKRAPEASEAEDGISSDDDGSTSG